MFKRLRILLTTICTLGTILVLAGMAVVSLRYPQQELMSQAEETFAGNLNTAFNYLQGQRLIDHVWLAQTEAAQGVYISIEDAGRPLQYTYNDPLRAALADRAKEIAMEEYGFDNTWTPAGTLQPVYVQFMMRHEGIGYRAAVCVAPVQNGWVGMTMIKSTAQEDSQILRLRLSFAAAGGGAALCLFVFAWFFTAQAVKPVEESHRKQTEFVSAASHELRSPLAVMQASAGAMQTAPLEQARAFARNIEGECIRLSSLASDLLTLAGADGQRWSIQLEEAEPETLLLTVGERYELLAREKRQSLAVRLPDDPLPKCRCDPQRIHQLLSILVDNAISYTPEGGRITLSCGPERRGVWFRVEDSGNGIPDDQKKLIFDRFYRADTSRTNREHYGLGLSIAREIAALHRSSLVVGDSPEGGAAFTLTLPVAQR